MKSKLFPLLIALAFAASGFGAEQGGWGKVLWGMSASDVQKEYPDATPKEKTRTSHVGLELKDFKIGSSAYHVRFFFDEKGGLFEVSLNLSVKEKSSVMQRVKTDLAAQSLREHLLQKYGPETVAKFDEIGRRWVWKKPGVTVTMMIMRIGESMPMVAVHYSRPDEEMLKNL